MIFTFKTFSGETIRGRASSPLQASLNCARRLYGRGPSVSVRTEDDQTFAVLVRRGRGPCYIFNRLELIS